MFNLQVEELEPRRLLNGTSFSPRPLLSQPFAGGTWNTRVAERSPFIDFGGDHAGPVGQGRPHEGGAESGPSGSLAPHRLDGRGPARTDRCAIPSAPPGPAGGCRGANAASAGTP